MQTWKINTEFQQLTRHTTDEKTDVSLDISRTYSLARLAGKATFDSACLHIARI
jgi:hypothetical protein